MAAASDSQGLKIAVAAFVTLTVVLAVTTYFAFSSYSEAQAKYLEEQKKATAAQQAAGEAGRNFETLKERAGYARIEDFAAVQDEIKKTNDKLTEQLTGINTQIKQMVAQYQAAGGNQQRVAELQQAADTLINGLTSLPEPNRTFADTQTRLTQLLDNLGQLSTQMILDNEDLQTKLKSVDTTNAQQLQVQVDEVTKAKDDLAKEHDRHEMEKQDLLAKYDELQNLTTRQATQIASLQQELGQLKDTTSKRQEQLLSNMRELREQVESKEDVMDVADGKVLFVDYTRGEIRTNISRRMGAKERMKLAVFDKDAPGLPSDRPKGVIELIQVSDQGSIGKILRTNQPSDPIRERDQLYSSAWSPNRPERFALIGKIDVDRDGRDDRDDLKRMIESAGGMVDFDLPPPGIGRETGELSPLTSWYVIDTREPIRPIGSAATVGLEDKDYLTRKSDVMEQARLSGVRPIGIEKLLAYLGYKYGEAEPGRVEALDRNTSRDLINPRGRVPAANGAQPPAGGQDTPPAPTEAPGAEPGTP